MGIPPRHGSTRVAECAPEPVTQALDIIAFYNQLSPIYPGRPEGTGVTLLQVAGICLLQTGIRISQKFYHLRRIHGAVPDPERAPAVLAFKGTAIAEHLLQKAPQAPVPEVMDTPAQCCNVQVSAVP